MFTSCALEVLYSYCVELSLVDKTLCENCFLLTLKWFQLYSFGEMSFLEESYKKVEKIQNFDICDAIWENPPHVAKGNFAENNQINLKIVMFFFIFY